MYGFCRLGSEPGAVGRRGLAGERARDEDEDQREEARDAAEHGHRPRQEPPDQVAVEGDRERAQPGEDEQPEQERAFLAAPEGAEGVRERELATRVVGHVGEREVAGVERLQQHERRDRRRAERAEERVPCRFVQSAPSLVGGETAGERRVEREPEGDDQSGAPEVGHAAECSGREFALVLR